MLNCKTKTLLHNSFIELHLRYLLVCWENVPKYFLNKIQKIQNKAIKQIFFFDFKIPRKIIYKENKILNYEKLKMYKHIKCIKCLQQNKLKTDLNKKTNTS